MPGYLDGMAAQLLPWFRNFDIPSGSDAVVRAAVPGQRLVVTDVFIENWGLASARAILKDGSSVLMRVTVGPQETWHHSFVTPLILSPGQAFTSAQSGVGSLTVTALGYVGA